MAIAYSCRFNDNDSASLSRAHGTGTPKTFTVSFWIKRCNLTAASMRIFSANQGGYESEIIFDSSDRLAFFDYFAGYRMEKRTNMVFRDPSAWYHIVCMRDGANTTAKIYVNGVEVTSWANNTGPLNEGSAFSNAATQYIGRYAASGVDYGDYYLADFYMVDGTVLTASSFGQTDNATGAWVPKDYTGSLGSQGFFLDFSNSAALGEDATGSNDYTASNLASTDQMLDTPDNNFCVMNSVFAHSTGGSLADGGLAATTAVSASYGLKQGTLFMPAGKWYFEMTALSASGLAVGLDGRNGGNITSRYLSNGDSFAYFYDGRIFGPSDAFPTTVASYTTNDVIGVAWDTAAGTLTVYKNNTSVYTWSNLVVGGAYTPAVSGLNATSGTASMNFGQGGRSGLTFDVASGGSFVYTPPSGYKALCTANYPVPAIPKPSTYFDAKTYTGNGSTQNITGLGFQPDLVWLKDRSATASHGLFDSTRGATILLSPDATSGNATDADTLTAFNSDGFSLGADTKFNTNTNLYASWAWKEAVLSGLDVVTWTGNGSSPRNISHGLGAVPAMIIVKRTDAPNTVSWRVYHVQGAATPQNGSLYLDATNAWTSDSGDWNNTAPTSSVFTVNANANVNTSTYVAYVFAAVPQFSAFASFTGNGAADGSFVYTGFKPRFVMIKRRDSATNWIIMDTARSTFNPANVNVAADAATAENVEAPGSTHIIDFLANGFKARGTGGALNVSGGIYLYAAFAELPFKYASSLGAAGPNFRASIIIG
jgi:hypothetical protein